MILGSQQIVRLSPTGTMPYGDFRNSETSVLARPSWSDFIALSLLTRFS